jgi:predicted ABC-type transport system involved in lysophospholipase L1 biosynthesis ATPase subunit
LSGGEQQRVAVARALMNSPRLVLADEPSGNLDARNAKVLEELLWSLTRERGASLVFVTHDEQLAQKADRCVRLQNGRLVEV